MKNLGVWFPTVRTGTGTDVFTQQLVNGLNQEGIRAEITWLPHYAEYLPWLVPIPQKPEWANVAHVNTWLHSRFLPHDIKVVATLHHCVQDRSFSPYKTVAQKIYHQFWITPIEKRCFKAADAITTVSQYTAKCINEIFDIDHVNVIYNGIDIDIFHPNSTIKSTNQDQPFKLIFVGSNSVRKGFNLLPEIMRQLGDDFQLFYTSNAEAYQPLPKNMIQLPPQKTAKDLANIYRTMDALIFPSRLEGFGLVVAEAMACGLPVVITDGSALTELVEHGKTGFLCEQDNVDAFAKAVRQLAGDKGLREKVANTAWQRVEKNFRVDRMIKHYVHVYRNVLSNRQRS